MKAGRQADDCPTFRGMAGLLLLLLLLTQSHTSGWNLSVPISHVTLCGARAFLCISRLHPQQPFTLIETPWPENSKLPMALKPFPPKAPQRVGECRCVQRAVAGAWDRLWHLYVLDAGWPQLCPPKIIVFHLITNKQVVTRELFDVPESRLNSLVVDSASVHGPRVYIGEPGLGQLIVYELRTGQCWKVHLSADTELGVVLPPTFLLAISGRNLFLASDNSDKLFTVDLTLLRVAKSDAFNASLVGQLLGPAQGLAVDRVGRSLSYCLARDYVCLRWDLTLPLIAENHKVLLQSADLLPHVYQLFLDIFNQLWALTTIKNGTHCVQLRSP